MTAQNLKQADVQGDEKIDKKQFFQFSALNDVISRLADTGFFLSQQLLILANPHIKD